MKKRDLKKLALMGITGGLMLGSQALSANNNDDANFGSYLAASCGGQGRQGGQGGCSSRNTPSNYYQGQNTGHSCSSQGGNNQPQGYAPSYSNQNQNWYPQNPTAQENTYQPQGSGHSCSGQNSYQPQAYSQSCSSCGNKKASQPSNAYTSSCSSCGNKKASQPSNAYTQSCSSCGNKKATQPSNAYTKSCASCHGQRPSTETADAYQAEHSCGGQKNSYYHIQTADQDQGNSYYPNTNNQTPKTNKNQKNTNPQASNTPYYNPGKTLADSQTTTTTTTTKKTLTEADLLNQLNAQGKATYQSLTPEGKALALKLANQSCKGQNDCKGLNACKTEKNACAGLGSCKGTSPAPFADKNDAVKVAAKKLAEKRNNANKVNGSGKLNK